MRRADQEIRAELQRLKRKGKILPADVVDAAREETSPMHRCFTWDDGEAAEQFRLIEARKLLQIYVVVEDGDVSPIRAFVSLTSDRSSGGGYRAMADVMSNRDLYDQMLSDALTQLRNMQEKYKRLKELEPVWKTVAQVSKRQSGKVKRAA
jgi:hypothetical protein